MTNPNVAPVNPAPVNPAPVNSPPGNVLGPAGNTVVTFVGKFHDSQMWDRFVGGMAEHLRALGVPCTVSLFIGDKAARAELFINDLAGDPSSGPTVPPLTEPAT